LLLYVHDQTNPNILPLLTSVSQLSDGVLVEVVLSGNRIQRVLRSVSDLGGVSVLNTHLLSLPVISLPSVAVNLVLLKGRNGLEMGEYILFQQRGTSP